jgi:hypothetical protein
MEITRIGDPYGSGEIERAAHGNFGRLCLYYKEEHCAAPRIKFAACRSCCRIDPHRAASNLFERIKKLAVDLLNLKEPGPPPLR